MNRKSTTQSEESIKNAKVKIFETIFTLPKPRRIAFAVSYGMLVFSLFLLMPLDLYLNNVSNFNIGLIHIFVPLLILSLCFFAFGLLLFPLIFRGILIEALSMLFTGVAIACYIQVLFLNGNMQELTGDIDSYLGSDIYISYFIWIVVLVAPIIIWKVLKDSPKYKAVKWERGVVYAAVITIGMQTAGIISVLFNYDFTKEHNPHHYFSYSKSFELSQTENICVFVMDRLDTIYMNEALKSNPELYTWLDGFTFYENNISTTNNTFPAVTQLLTGVSYEVGDSWSSYWDKAWGERGLIDVLRDNGYKTMLLPDKLTTYGNFSQLIHRADNLTQANRVDFPINHSVVLRTILDISFGKVAPYSSKGAFIYRYQSDFSNYFYEYQIDDAALQTVSDRTDINYYSRLKANGLSAEQEDKIFSFVHLNASHDGTYIYNSETNAMEITETKSINSSTYACFVILKEYFEQMKELGIYDNSTIILIADHGRGVQNELTEAITSSLLIKPVNSSGALKIDSVSELSHINFIPSILEAAGLEHEAFGYSYLDIIVPQTPQVRKFYLYNWGGFGKIEPAAVYEVIGDANDFSNWDRFLGE
ncbi:MAG: sulfatase-like hydrolase/transferase [Oscillospiraceae bacterium]|nr:sulfatase-like hydrolase/transferase [Oscillospiraceae bacterium]